MSATARSFTVFLDAPPADPVKPQQASDISQSHSHDALSVSDLLSPAAAAKENLHPVTGESTTSSKKRKTSSVLATKAIHPPTSKKQKESKESKESQSTAVLKPKSETTKKRKASISASASSPLKAKAKGAVASEKEPKRTVLGGVPATKKKSSSGSSRVSKRKVTPLPKLEEVHEVAEAAEGEAGEGTMTQANVDSRCYELTVLPLADVTQAYDASPTMDYIPLGEEPSTKANAALSRALRAKSSEPDLRDCYTPSLTHSQSSSSTSSVSKRASSMPPARSSAEEAEEDGGKTFTTPERKQIYAAFTFSSPSPTGARFGLTRSASVDALQFGFGDA